MNVVVNNIICFYSKYSKVSQEFMKLAQRQKKEKIQFVCIDNKEIREKIKKDKVINVTEVPCIMKLYSNELIEKMTTAESFKWIQDILEKQVQEERHEYNLLIQQEQQRQMEKQKQQEQLRQEEQQRQQALAQQNNESKTVLFDEGVDNVLQEEFDGNLKSNNIEKQENKSVENKSIVNNKIRPTLKGSMMSGINMTELEHISKNIVSKNAEKKKVSFAQTVRNNKFKPTELNLLEDNMENSQNMSKLDDLSDSEGEEEEDLPPGVKSTPHNINSEFKQGEGGNKVGAELMKLKTQVVKPLQMEEKQKKKLNEKLDTGDILAMAKQMEKDRAEE